MANDLSAQLVDVQTQLTFQEDMLNALNERVVAQDLELRNLRRTIELLHEQMKQKNTAGEESLLVGIERPPHY
ncbi:Protein SlyX [Zhongshania aliphaticivorans]|uniref:Protein SlyX n=1 Tax=Zhongshania aliphaticivorans TaxID=1470434 RepID=A0A5S9QAL5_9GAMM|nr:SlyX family protein [Zhongshania aliphaticivorans]CAA0087437.1 Protein SlyX [Zhongshania aliphaticivorans]CAA0114863.1 Protein SlyX [Zhongshania aliphaticivorans]CAA0119675.1 Protein SlyX [Zhongshania aliphaticivorans]